MTQPVKKKAGTVSLYGGQPVVFFKYDKKTIKIVSALPGATWLPGVQGWRVSPAAVDMLAKMGFRISPSVQELRKRKKPNDKQDSSQKNCKHSYRKR